ncbi:PREDICTED: uncharacterized protein LOC105963544 isoform X2 [Erythranthe guttata]|uniref:uncharacterized protein LOC105963544 isoform X2 n=1 Tax=Erythranthe guttata TaxID=4155 RepID=UPI00064DE73E|nr:PREDICTED: uncharacterized protein LOC105963544 isoform X2 [Erythranthe guttata]|eukprot:XP_012843406.1 PREDICTED: uncharacterized protein LOC105963544 isoform X2 [Erythranthe guttata]
MTSSSSTTMSSLVTINAAAQLPLKLTSTNYFSWKAQFHALLYGLDLLGYLDGSKPCPTATTSADGSSNPEHILWRRQDQLLLHAIFASLSEAVIPLVSSATTSKDAWNRLHRLYAKRSTSHIIHLKDKLSSITRGTSSVTEFLVSIKQIADELTALGDPPSDADLLIYTTRGLGIAYKELITALRTRDSVVPFEELFDKIIDHESFLLHNEKQYSDVTPPTAHIATHPSRFRQTKRSSITPSHGVLPTPHQPKNFPTRSIQTLCQYCDKRGHDAKRCFKLFPHLRHNHPSANHTTVASPQNNQWILDSGASHHVTSQLSNLSVHQPYGGPDDVHIGDGSGFTYGDTSAPRTEST